MPTSNLIGFARILTDSYKYAYIHDVIIDVHFRGLGLGKFLMDSIIQSPKLENIKYFELTCDPEMTRFYERCGFFNDFAGAVPMRRANPNSTVS